MACSPHRAHRSSRWTGIAAGALALALSPLLSGISNARADEPAHLELEERDSAAVHTVIDAWNQRTLDRLSHEVGFETYRQRALGMLTSSARIAEPSQIQNGWVLNFWQDQQNPQGVLRTTRLTEFAAAKKRGWQTVLDLDGLNQKQHAHWVYDFRPDT